jgi:Flp pilus assembly protein TadB
MEKQIENLTAAIEDLTLEISLLNTGQMYGGNLTDAINILAEVIAKQEK